MNVNSTVEVSIHFPSSSQLRLELKRKHLSRLQCLHPDQVIHKTLSHHLVQEVQVWMDMETIQANHILSHQLPLDKNINVHRHNRTHRLHILQVGNEYNFFLILILIFETLVENKFFQLYASFILFYQCISCY